MGPLIWFRCQWCSGFLVQDVYVDACDLVGCGFSCALYRPSQVWFAAQHCPNAVSKPCRPRLRYAPVSLQRIVGKRLVVQVRRFSAACEVFALALHSACSLHIPNINKRKASWQGIKFVITPEANVFYATSAASISPATSQNLLQSTKFLQPVILMLLESSLICHLYLTSLC